MDEYIDRDAFKESVEERYCLPCKEVGKDYNGCRCRACWVDDMLDEVINAPTADVAPVIHAHWIEQEDVNLDTYYTCSSCKEDFDLIAGTPCENLYNYCPNCGAKMDETVEDDKR